MTQQEYYEYVASKTGKTPAEVQTIIKTFFDLVEDQNVSYGKRTIMARSIYKKGKKQGFTIF